MPNIEIKALCHNLDHVRTIANENMTDYVGVLHQIDTYFKTSHGRLKLREMNGEVAQLIPYSKDYQSGPMKSDYALLPVDEPKVVKALLDKLLGIEFIVDKKREVFLIDNVRVHLDQVTGLGNFIELEAVCALDTQEEYIKQKSQLDRLLHVFNIKSVDLLDLSYVDYLAPHSSSLSP